jgi:hypothetical protein
VLVAELLPEAARAMISAGVSSVQTEYPSHTAAQENTHRF